MLLKHRKYLLGKIPDFFFVFRIKTPNGYCKKSQLKRVETIGIFLFSFIPELNPGLNHRSFHLKSLRLDLELWCHQS